MVARRWLARLVARCQCLILVSSALIRRDSASMLSTSVTSAERAVVGTRGRRQRAGSVADILRNDDAELGQMAAQRIDQDGALTHQGVTGLVDHQRPWCSAVFNGTKRIEGR
jgi:hypothetical protein